MTDLFATTEQHVLIANIIKRVIRFVNETAPESLKAARDIDSWIEPTLSSSKQRFVSENKLTHRLVG
jgi:hypothetical protein